MGPRVVLFAAAVAGLAVACFSDLVRIDVNTCPTTEPSWPVFIARHALAFFKLIFTPFVASAKAAAESPFAFLAFCVVMYDYLERRERIREALRRAAKEAEEADKETASASSNDDVCGHRADDQRQQRNAPQQSRFNIGCPDCVSQVVKQAITELGDATRTQEQLSRVLDVVGELCTSNRNLHGCVYGLLKWQRSEGRLEDELNGYGEDLKAHNELDLDGGDLEFMPDIKPDELSVSYGVPMLNTSGELAYSPDSPNRTVDLEPDVELSPCDMEWDSFG